jgi:hypothetical protein
MTDDVKVRMQLHWNEGCERARDRSQLKNPTIKCLRMRTISFGICDNLNSVQLWTFCVSGTPEILK